MPLLEPSEVVALGLSPKNIPAHKPQTPRKNPQGASQVGAGRVTNYAHTRRGPRNLLSTSSYSSKSDTSTSNSASPTLSTSRFALEAGAEVGSNFEVCIKIPSKRKLAVLQRYERFPDADMATKEARVDIEGMHKKEQEEPVKDGLPKESARETVKPAPASTELEPPTGLVKEDQPGPEEHSKGPNGTSADIHTSDKQPIPEPEAPIVPITSDISL
ncbi:hypothetical protein TWF281_010053 [Arthrobotrys megalospora]